MNLEEESRKINYFEERDKNERTLLKSIFDSLQDLTFVFDLNQRITKVNKAFCKFFGIQEQQVIGARCYEILNKSGIECSKEEIFNIIANICETKVTLVKIYTSKEPTEIFWEATFTPIFDDYGNIYLILTAWHNISEMMKLRREIENLEKKLRSFVNNAQDWISMKDIEGRYIIVNPVIAEAFGKRPEEFIGKTPEEVLPANLAKTIRVHDSLVLRSGKPAMFNEIINMNGEERHFRMLRFPLTDQTGKIIGTCTIGRDTTNEVQLMERLIQSEKLAALGRLAAGVAHEINNPLTGILSFAESIAEELEPNNPLREDVQIIVRETLRCRDIVQNLLDFAKQHTPKLEVVSPNEIVRQSIELIHKIPSFKDIQILVDYDTNIPMIKADANQIQQVILNLILNSADAMNYKGKINVITKYFRNQNKCTISVEDNGPGIPKNLLEKIFEPFFSTKNTSGLGLAVSWGIIERHNGTIEVDNAPNGGAIFTIVLPPYFQSEHKQKATLEQWKK
ncbi:MAG: PAS domain-containing protein [Ignavibacteria bacterium]|nr:PAS domain-containing protein [Ignavibacteria bacterium]